MLAQSRMHDQLLCLQLRPHSVGHFLPVNVLILRAVRAPRGPCRNHGRRQTIHHLAVFSDPSAAFLADLHMPLRLPDDIWMESRRAWSGSRNRWHQCIQLFAVDMLIHWTRHSSRLPTTNTSSRANLLFLLPHRRENLDRL